MNLVFLTLSNVNSIDSRGIYSDLLRKFRNEGHNVYVVSPIERRNNKETHIIKEENCTILKVRTGNIQKTNVIEKGIATVLLETQFINAIKKHFSDVKFDLILYSTPPITLAGAIKYIKQRDGAKTYLLLKDIFPQNAIDIGMMRKSGVRGILYKWFRRKEKKLYALSDRIGCMSQANVDYVIKHNPEVSSEKVEICPNSIEAIDMSVSAEVRGDIRRKYDIPLDKKVFIYGGNLGRPQGIPFMIECLRKCRDTSDALFIVIGNGTEYGKIQAFLENENQENVRLLPRLPKEDYDRLAASCDVGLIFLDHRFTIPNFPSRLLAYMQAKVPVLACTDPNTDIGKVICDGGFGWWCESNDSDTFKMKIEEILKESDIAEMQKREYEYLRENFSVDVNYKKIMESINNV